MEYEEAFQKIKQYLGGIQVLAKLRIGEDLMLYLSVSEHTVSGMLVRDEGVVQTPIYYVSKALKDKETRYSEIEKLALTLVVAARRLSPYIQEHVILVPTSHPLRQVLQNPDVSRRLVKYTIELGEFDIKFMPRTTIKGQALAHFVVAFIYPTMTLGGVIDKLSTSVEHKKDDEPIDPSKVWNLRIYGSSNVNRSGMGVILESPTGEKISYALRLEFPALNNEAEYEALLARLRLAKEIRAEQLIIYSDFQLVVT